MASKSGVGAHVYLKRKVSASFEGWARFAHRENSHRSEFSVSFLAQQKINPIYLGACVGAKTQFLWV